MSISLSFRAFAALVGAVCSSDLACARADSVDKALSQADIQVFDQGHGSLLTASFEWQRSSSSGLWGFGAVMGRREQGGVSQAALAGSLRWHHNWTGKFSTTTEGLASDSVGPLARASFSQSMSFRVGSRTSVAAGARWSRYSGGGDVWFVSGELRQSFHRGSAAYRLSWIIPPARSAYATHLVALTLDDVRGSGRTQLWMSAGQASLTTSLLPDTFRGHDWGVQLRRVQPLSPNLSLLLSLGMASYDRRPSTLKARNAGLGVAMTF